MKLKQFSISLLSSAIILAGCGVLTDPVSLIKAPQTVHANTVDYNELGNIAEKFLPTGATLHGAAFPIDAKPVQEFDLDWDGKNELLVTYQLKGTSSEAGVIVLKQEQDEWKKVWEQKGLGYDFTYAGFADITGDGKEELLIGWTIGASAGSILEIYEWSEKSFTKLSSLSYNKLELFEVKDTELEDRNTRLATWQKDTGDVFMVDVYKWDGVELIQDKQSYPLYFPEVINYYQQKLTMDPQPLYWYYLADAQLKAGKFEDAIESAEQGLELNPEYYPEPSQYQKIIDQAEIELMNKHSIDVKYENEKFNFSLVFPKEWKGKMVIEEHEDGMEDQPIMSVSYQTIEGDKEPFFDVHVYPEYVWKEELYEEMSLLKPFGTKDGYVFAYVGSSEHPYANEEGSKNYNEYTQLMQQMNQIVDSFKFGIPSIQKQEITRMNAMILKGQKRFYYVMSGGSGEVETFTNEGNEYRYLSEDIDSNEKVLTYLEQSFSRDAAATFLEQTSFIIENGRLAQPNADGGSILNWENAVAIILSESEGEKTYQYTVPLGNTFDTVTIEVSFIKGKDGWKLNTNPFDLT
ncbi:tetratricopeptide repeat protein [bacterium LRH843]|nr:tetratricopeptide repeat protein [bacterium LRH843]